MEAEMAKDSITAKAGNSLNPEVPEKPRRRRFTAEYKLSIVTEADACTSSGEVGALLRREGLYSSHLSTWRRQRDEGQLQALSPKKRGRRARRNDPLAAELAQVRREKAVVERKLKQAELIIGIQKKACEMLGIPLTIDDEDESSS
jgi:transposase-like protein